MCVCVCMYVCMYVCIYIYIHTYIHKYIHILKNKETAEKIVLTSTCKSYMGSRWYTPDFHLLYCVVMVK